MNDTFTTAWRHWDRRPAAGELLPWLYAIAGNAVRDQRRSAGRQSRLIARLAAVGRAGHAADPADGIVLGQAVAEAFARLSAADREVLSLVAWEGMTDAGAIGLVLGLSPAAVRTRIHRARRRLRSLLSEPADSQPADRQPADQPPADQPPADQPPEAAGLPRPSSAGNRVPEVPNVQ